MSKIKRILSMSLGATLLSFALSGTSEAQPGYDYNPGQLIDGGLVFTQPVQPIASPSVNLGTTGFSSTTNSDGSTTNSWANGLSITSAAPTPGSAPYAGTPYAQDYLNGTGAFAPNAYSGGGLSTGGLGGEYNLGPISSIGGTIDLPPTYGTTGGSASTTGFSGFGDFGFGGSTGGFSDFGSVDLFGGSTGGFSDFGSVDLFGGSTGGFGDFGFSDFGFGGSGSSGSGSYFNLIGDLGGSGSGSIGGSFGDLWSSFGQSGSAGGISDLISSSNVGNYLGGGASDILDSFGLGGLTDGVQASDLGFGTPVNFNPGGFGQDIFPTTDFVSSITALGNIEGLGGFADMFGSFANKDWAQELGISDALESGQDQLMNAASDAFGNFTDALGAQFGDAFGDFSLGGIGDSLGLGDFNLGDALGGFGLDSLDLGGFDLGSFDFGGFDLGSIGGDLLGGDLLGGIGLDSIMGGLDLGSITGGILDNLTGSLTDMIGGQLTSLLGGFDFGSILGGIGSFFG